MRKKMRVYTAAKIAADQGHEPEAILAAVAGALQASAADAEASAADPRYQIGVRLAALLDDLRLPTPAQAAGMVRTVVATMRVEARGFLEHARDEADKDVAKLLAQDSDDLENIAIDLEAGRPLQAERYAARLDTAARDRLPLEVCRLFGWAVLTPRRRGRVQS